MYLMRNVTPTIKLQHANQFDSVIEKMLAQYFNINLDSAKVLEDTVPGSRLDSEQSIQLAKFQIRNSEVRGGLGLK